MASGHLNESYLVREISPTSPDQWSYAGSVDGEAPTAMDGALEAIAEIRFGAVRRFSNDPQWVLAMDAGQAAGLSRDSRNVPRLSAAVFAPIGHEHVKSAYVGCHPGP